MRKRTNKNELKFISIIFELITTSSRSLLRSSTLLIDYAQHHNNYEYHFHSLEPQDIDCGMSHIFVMQI